MPVWLINILVSLATKILLSLYEKLAAGVKTEKDVEAIHNEVNKNLQAFKAAYEEAVDGEPITPEQREKLKIAIRGFVRGYSSNGL